MNIEEAKKKIIGYFSEKKRGLMIIPKEIELTEELKRDIKAVCQQFEPKKNIKLFILDDKKEINTIVVSYD